MVRNLVQYCMAQKGCCQLINLKGDNMGEWLSSNVLLPLMYFLIDIGIAFAVLLLAMHLLEKLISSQIFKNIRK